LAYLKEVARDIGQLENGNRIIIEVGDPQFLGISQSLILELWNSLKVVINDNYFSLTNWF
jgi:hypothetical protein